MNRFYVWQAGGVTVLALASRSTPSVSTSKAGVPVEHQAQRLTALQKLTKYLATAAKV
jgi:heme exporter protein D